ncbi:MAG: hypothetical protein KBS95_02985 [Alistipes sp.]|nr:hypothetical protein [Candidatus Alistipes equi]
MSKEENYTDYEDDEIREESSNRALKGYKILVIVLAVILVGMSFLYYRINSIQKADYELLRIDRDSIQSNLNGLIEQYDGLKYENDSIAANLEKANEVMEQLKNERTWTYSKLKQYEKEVGTLRAVMKTYLRQIDSLNRLNKQLSNENVKYRKEISTANLRAEVAEERAVELNNRVQQGAVLKARGILLTPLNRKDKEISRISKAQTLRVDLTIAANDFATPGIRNVYVRIVSPDGYLIAPQTVPTFSYQEEQLGYTAVREVDYRNEDLDVSIFFRGNGFVPGKYTIEVYADGNMMAFSDIVMK